MRRKLGVFTIIAVLITNPAYSLRAPLLCNDSEESLSSIFGAVRERRIKGPTLEKVLKAAIRKTQDLKPFLDAVVPDKILSPEEMEDRVLQTKRQYLEMRIGFDFFIAEIFSRFLIDRLSNVEDGRQAVLDILYGVIHSQWNKKAKHIKFISVEEKVLKANARRYYDEKSQTVYIAFNHSYFKLYNGWVHDLISVTAISGHENNIRERWLEIALDVSYYICFERILEELAHKNRDTSSRTDVIEEELRVLVDVWIPIYERVVYNDRKFFRKINTFFSESKNISWYRLYSAKKGVKLIQKILSKNWLELNREKAVKSLRRFVKRRVVKEPVDRGYAFILAHRIPPPFIRSSN